MKKEWKRKQWVYFIESLPTDNDDDDDVVDFFFLVSFFLRRFNFAKSSSGDGVRGDGELHANIQNIHRLTLTVGWNV